jgi:hypothetical protein
VEVSISFTVTNTSGVIAENVNLAISASQIVTPVAIVVSTGSFTNAPGSSLINWNVGALNPGQSATITFDQVGSRRFSNTWTAVGTTTTPEITIADNTATVIVPALLQ